ncbi:histone-fold-containing protein [Hesseltinella vesiculosa]|uniref:Histone-fold-containing protein n=1 Tax=Hesseltinella vesiculosa TaxID=101127 RepID=A0A1X2GI98_9FUNG|nr:histone-fold-containing protein [Hesseltinella vesiculosa]
MATNNDPHYHQQAGNPVMAAAATAVSSGPTAPGGHPVFDLNKFWQEQMASVDASEPDFKNHPLPLARIKKVMKTDQDVKMISAEAPILFAKGCEIFITELTKRAWVHAEENKRRTLQRSDIATAISKTDMCDFLIDIVPREEATKAAPTAVYDQQQNYASYYQQQAGGLPAYTHGQVPQQQMETPYYPQLSSLTPEQVQQYQLQLQQFAQAQQAQQAQPQQAQQAQAQQHSFAPAQDQSAPKDK